MQAFNVWRSCKKVCAALGNCVAGFRSFPFFRCKSFFKAPSSSLNYFMLHFAILSKTDDSFRKLLLDLKNDIYKVHGDLASRITELHKILRRIEGHWPRNADELNTEAEEVPPELPRVPGYLEVRFETAIKAANPELQDDKSFPLAKGVNAFHHHFEQVSPVSMLEKSKAYSGKSTSKFQPETTLMAGDFFADRTPQPTQYLNLMKSIWIIQKVKKGEEYKIASSDCLWDCYIKELDEVGRS